MNVTTLSIKSCIACLVAPVLSSSVFSRDADSLIIQITSEKIFSQQVIEIKPPLNLKIGDTEEKILISQSTPPDIEVFSVKISAPEQYVPIVSFGYCSSSGFEPVHSIEREGVDLGHKVMHGSSGISDHVHYVCHRIGDTEALTLVISLETTMKIVATLRSPALETPLGTSHARLKMIGKDQYSWVMPE